MAVCWRSKATRRRAPICATRSALDEQVYTLKLTPNLAHCMSITGVAREVAAITGASYAGPAWQPVPVTLSDRLAVSILAPELCGRFCGRIVRGVDARAPTPAWMRSSDSSAPASARSRRWSTSRTT